jgi:hypothetical protein
VITAAREAVAAFHDADASLTAGGQALADFLIIHLYWAIRSLAPRLPNSASSVAKGPERQGQASPARRVRPVAADAVEIEVKGGAAVPQGNRSGKVGVAKPTASLQACVGTGGVEVFDAERREDGHEQFALGGVIGSS